MLSVCADTIRNYASVELRGFAREKMLTGELPSCEAVVCHTRPGRDEVCSLCEQPVALHEIIFFMLFDKAWTGEPFFMHLRCFGLWRDERIRLRDARMMSARAG